MFLDLVQPDWNTKEALPVGQVKDHNDSVSTLVIGVGDGSIAFLPCCVPNLQLDRALVDLKCAETEVNTDSANVVFLEAVILFTSNFSKSSLVHFCCKFLAHLPQT